MRWHAPDVMVGVFSEDEIDDPVDTLGPIEGQLTILEDDIEDAELVPETLATMLEVTNGLDADTKADLRQWVEVQGWPKDKKQLSEDQAQQVLDWIERRD